MVTLGDYAAEVLSAYAISLALLALLVWSSVRGWRRAKMRLDAVEKGHG